MDKLLSKDSITIILQQTGEIEAPINVYSETFQMSMTLIGFVPHNDLEELSFSEPTIDLNRDIVYTPYRIKLTALEKAFPVMKKIRKAENEERFLIRRGLVTPYEGTHFTRYYQILEREDISEEDKKKFLPSFLDSYPLKLVKKSKYYIANSLSINDEGMLVYKAFPNAFVSSRTYGDYIVISHRYLCLCAYINSITGLPSYSLFDPEDIYKTESAKK